MLTGETITCTECEEYCTGMQVYVSNDIEFILCERREDTNRIRLDEMKPWDEMFSEGKC